MRTARTIQKKKWTKKVIRQNSRCSKFICPLAYVKNRIPFEKEEPLNQFAFIWAEKIGHREKMADIVKSSDVGFFCTSFFEFQAENERKNGNRRARVLLGNGFSGRQKRDEKNGLCGQMGSIGDEDEMRSRLQTRFWKYQFDQKVNGEKVNYATP